MTDTITLRRDGIEATPTVRVGDVVPMMDGSQWTVGEMMEPYCGHTTFGMKRDAVFGARYRIDGVPLITGGVPWIDIAKLAEQQRAARPAADLSPTALVNEAAEYIVHRPECAHGGRGDEYCDCGAVGFLSRLEAMLTADDVDQEYSNEIMLRGRSVLARPAAVPAEAIRALKNRIDARLNNHLCDMREGWDDSVSGFNDAWDIVRKVFDEDLAALLPKEKANG